MVPAVPQPFFQEPVPSDILKISFSAHQFLESCDLWTEMPIPGVATGRAPGRVLLPCLLALLWLSLGYLQLEVATWVLRQRVPKAEGCQTDRSKVNSMGWPLAGRQVGLLWVRGKEHPRGKGPERVRRKGCKSCGHLEGCLQAVAKTKLMAEPQAWLPA